MSEAFRQCGDPANNPRKSIYQNPRMTIGIGLISRPPGEPAQIVLASEGQTTFEDGSKQTDTNKIVSVDFLNGRILLVQAGYSEPALKAIQLFRTKAKSVSLENEQKVVCVLEESMREIRQQILSGWDFSDERKSTYIQIENNCEFLVAFFILGKPHLFHIDLARCLATERHSSFDSIGIGTDLAKFLLGEHARFDRRFHLSEIIACSVIETVKENVKDCSGQTRIGIASPRSQGQEVSETFILPTTLVNSMVAEIKSQEPNIAKSKIEHMYDAMCSLCKKVGPIIYRSHQDGNGWHRAAIYGKTESEIEELTAKLVEIARHEPL